MQQLQMMMWIQFIIGFRHRERTRVCGKSSIQRELWQLAGAEIGDLKTFDSKDAMKSKMKETFDASLSYKNAAHATWQFVNDMKIGDIVFVKKGMHQLVGRGVVSSDYEYDADCNDKYGNIRNGELSA